jgi:hypothetical protein
MAQYRQRYLWRWQTSYLPRLTWPDAQTPRFVRQCGVTWPIVQQLRLLDWECLPRPAHKQHFGQQPVPLSAYIATYLVKLILEIGTMGKLRRFLVAHPALVWALGYPLVADLNVAHGFLADASLPSRRQLNRVLSEMDNAHLQALLDAQVTRFQSWFPQSFGQTISLDTKHILAWTKENNPRQYIKEGRYDPTQQPAGDPDCKLGVKRSHNLIISTPASQGKPADKLSVARKEYYWGYASGAVVTKLPDWGEFILAEITQTFDKGDTTYFFPLMEQVERRLGFRPRYGALDAAFDAFYIYDFFNSEEHDGFAAIPFSEKGVKTVRRQFDEAGLPLCAAGLSMPLKFTYNDRTTAIIPYRRAKHVCPLYHPEPTDEPCPIKHKKWVKGGCSTHLAATPGARIRHQLDREGEKYKTVYAQRTAVERIFSQAKALGMEQPKLRNQKSIANQNTLIYLLINLRTMQRVLNKLTDIEKK